jgi:hypothetical protein
MGKGDGHVMGNGGSSYLVAMGRGHEISQPANVCMDMMGSLDMGHRDRAAKILVVLPAVESVSLHNYIYPLSISMLYEPHPQATPAVPRTQAVASGGKSRYTL